MNNPTLSDSTAFGVRLTFAKWVTVAAFTVAGISGLAIDRYVLSETNKANREELRRQKSEIESLKTEVRALQDWKIREEARDGKTGT